MLTKYKQQTFGASPVSEHLRSRAWHTKGVGGPHHARPPSSPEWRLFAYCTRDSFEAKSTWWRSKTGLYNRHWCWP